MLCTRSSCPNHNRPWKLAAAVRIGFSRPAGRPSFAGCRRGSGLEASEPVRNTPISPAGDEEGEEDAGGREGESERGGRAAVITIPPGEDRGDRDQRQASLFERGSKTAQETTRRQRANVAVSPQRSGSGAWAGEPIEAVSGVVGRGDGHHRRHPHHHRWSAGHSRMMLGWRRAR